MPDVNWHDCIKSHHKGLGQVKHVLERKKRVEKKKRKGKENEKGRKEKNRNKKVNIIGRIVLDKFRLV